MLIPEGTEHTLQVGRAGTQTQNFTPEVESSQLLLSWHIHPCTRFQLQNRHHQARGRPRESPTAEPQYPFSPFSVSSSAKWVIGRKHLALSEQPKAILGLQNTKPTRRVQGKGFLE